MVQPPLPDLFSGNSPKECQLKYGQIDLKKNPPILADGSRWNINASQVEPHREGSLLFQLHLYLNTSHLLRQVCVSGTGMIICLVVVCCSTSLVWIVLISTVSMQLQLQDLRPNIVEDQLHCLTSYRRAKRCCQFLVSALCSGAASFNKKWIKTV